MLNQASREALLSAAFLEHYLDCVENLPDDLQFMVSRLRELDIRYQSVFGELDRRQMALQSAPAAGQQQPLESQRCRTLVAMQNALIVLQEVADEKLAVVQMFHDTLDAKSRQLQQHASKFGSCELGASRAPSVISATCSATASQTANDSPASPTAGTATADSVGRRKRRARRTRAILDADADTGGDATPPPPSATSGSVNSAKHKQLRSNSAATKRRKRKTQQERDRSPMEVAIDPDEPTYCLCEQVFFGEMIGCDNDLCPIEWFHFSCVNIVHKPKGRWFCPRCRGDRTNVMKPKHVFLRELQRYNKQKEEERDKKSY